MSGHHDPWPFRGGDEELELAPKPAKPVSKEVDWDSRLLFIGGAVFVLLIVAFVALYFAVFRGPNHVSGPEVSSEPANPWDFDAKVTTLLTIGVVGVWGIVVMLGVIAVVLGAIVIMLRDRRSIESSSESRKPPPTKHAG